MSPVIGYPFTQSVTLCRAAVCLLCLWGWAVPCLSVISSYPIYNLTKQYHLSTTSTTQAHVRWARTCIWDTLLGWISALQSLRQDRLSALWADCHRSGVAAIKTSPPSIFTSRMLWHFLLALQHYGIDQAQLHHYYQNGSHTHSHWSL